MRAYENRKHLCCVGLRAEGEGRRLLSPFQLMCGMGAPLVSAVVSRDKLQLLGAPQI